MYRQTFEQALRQTLSNSRLSRILDDELPQHQWIEALSQDKKDVENIIDLLCSDLSKITGRRIKRFTKLRSPIPPPWELNEVDFAYQHLNMSIKTFIHCIFANIHPENSADILTYPISKVCWRKYGVTVKWPDPLHRIEIIKLHEPDQLTPDQVDKPKHIKRLLEICEYTCFDYQPYVLKDEKSKILVLKLGSEWPDLMIGEWKTQQFGLKGCTALFSSFCFLMMLLGLYGATFRANNFWIPLLFISVIMGVVGGLATTLLVSLLFKPLKV